MWGRKRRRVIEKIGEGVGGPAKQRWEEEVSSVVMEEEVWLHGAAVTFTMSLIREYLNIQSRVILSFSRMSCTQWT